MEMVFKIWKITAMACGGLVGWMIGEFKPAFLLTVVVVVFILYVAWTAFKLDKRVRTAYPDKTQRKQAKFTSFAFGKVVKQTIPKRLMLIILAFLAEHWVFIYVTTPLSYVVQVQSASSCSGRSWRTRAAADRNLRVGFGS